MQQVVRTLTAADDGLLVQHRVLVCDRDTKGSAPVRVRIGDAGIRFVQTPYRAPNANAYAERFVRSIKEECLSRVIPLGERHLRRTIAEYVEHYHRERNHQRIGNALIVGATPPAPSGAFADVRVWVDYSTTTIVRRDRRFDRAMRYYAHIIFADHSTNKRCRPSALAVTPRWTAQLLPARSR